MKNLGKLHLVVWISISVFVLDQISKLIVRTTLKLNDPVALIKGFFSITYIHNYGAGFGILQHQTWLFIIFAVAAVAGIILFYRKIPQDTYVQVGIALLLGGIIGNLVDRLFYGYVTDFIDFSFWPAFNIADSGISIGAFLLAVYIVKSDIKKQKVINKKK